MAEQTDRDAARMRSLIILMKDRSGHDRRYAIDCARFEQDLGWTQAHDFRAGLREAVTWYLEHMDWVEGVRSGA